MIQFFLKGIIRDKGRSVLPITIIASGVALTILLSGYIRGVMGDMVEQNANFDTGHVKVMTRAYAKERQQLPNDLAILEVDSLKGILQNKYSTITWVERIKFGGLIDVPDENGETLKQGPISGLAIELNTENPTEINRLHIKKSIVKGALPVNKGEILMGNALFERLALKIGDKVTYLGTTMNGSMTSHNFIVAGTLHFGNSVMDNSSVLIDINEAQLMLDMENASSELLGYFNNAVYDDANATNIAASFNANYKQSKDEFAPLMETLKNQNNLAAYIDYTDVYASLFIMLFVIAMSVVLWNTGLLGGLRRFQEFGVRLALGESKTHIYKSLLIEAFLIGIIGSFIGTISGIAMTVYLQIYGIDITPYLKRTSMMMPSIVRAKFTTDLLYIGFIPGVLAIMLGNILSGLVIYKRKTAELFKELEV
ncbi:putative ABC transport system permease protein [Tenacibaculum sp. 190524A02b]|uniref:ABC transport system permease protein n=1 Tax=Tenacibaculum vairaonense TaxID=3137860 RepID=A0ABM9PM49_9FLAO